MTEISSDAYLANYYFGRGGRQTERRFNAVSDESQRLSKAA
jgi:hypothetical protein